MEYITKNQNTLKCGVTTFEEELSILKEYFAPTESSPNSKLFVSTMAVKIAQRIFFSNVVSSVKAQLCHDSLIVPPVTFTSFFVCVDLRSIVKVMQRLYPLHLLTRHSRGLLV